MTIEEMFVKAFDDETLQSRFYYELLQSNIYVLGEAANVSEGIVEEGSEVQLVTLTNEGVTYVPIFLSLEAMDDFLEGERQEYMRAMGCDLLETLKQSNIVINPGQESSIALYADEVQQILSQGKN